jgi:hypothetical protein
MRAWSRVWLVTAEFCVDSTDVEHLSIEAGWVHWPDQGLDFQPSPPEPLIGGACRLSP